MGFADALGIIGGGDFAPLPASPPGSQGQAVPRVFINKGQEASPAPAASSSWSNALQILGGSEPPPPAKPVEKKEISAGKSFYTGAKSGVSANFSDEMSGLASAGRTLLPDIINPDKPGSAISERAFPLLGDIILGVAGAGRLAYEGMTGGGEGTAAYERARDEERQNQKMAMEQHPVANIAGNLAGAVALPVGGMASAATMPGRMAAGAGLGSAYGAAYGAGEGEGAGDRATRAATGAVLGGVAGAVAPPILAGVAAGGRAIGSAAGRVMGHPIQTIRGAINPEQEAARRIGTNILADMETGRPGMSAADLAAAQRSGQPAAIIDIGGENTRALARSAANTSPAGRAALEDMATDRFKDQSGRVASFVRSLVPVSISRPTGTASSRISDTFRSLTSGTKTAEEIELIKEAARKANGPAYAKAYESGDKQIWTPELERLTGAPFVQSALRSAISKWKNYAVRDGYGSMNSPFMIENGVITRSGGKGMPVYPNIQLWDYAARNLQDKARSAAPGSESSKLYNDLARLVKDELDKIVPEYRSAREGAASFFGARNAVEAGKSFASSGANIGEAKIAHSKMNDAEKQLFSHGFAQEMLEKLNRSGESSGVSSSPILSSPSAREKMEMAFGPKDYAKIDSALAKEKLTAVFDGSENAFDAGRKFVSMRGPLDGARIAHMKMTQPQKSYFAEGFVSDIADKVLKISDNRSITIDRIFNSPDGRARAELALGKGRAQELELFLRRENMMDLARTAVKGNSTTTRQLVEAGIAGGIGGSAGGAADAAMSGRVDAKSILTGALLGGAAMGHRAINFKVAQRVGEMLASEDPKVLMTAIRMAKTNPDAGRALRKAETLLEKLVGSRSNEAAPMLPGVVPGRADEQQQQ